MKLLVLNDPASLYLKVLAHLPDGVDIVVGDSAEAFAGHLEDAGALFVGLNQVPLFGELWPRAKRARWVHSFSAGVESILTTGLATSPVPLTNGRGVFAPSLAEFVIASALFFAKSLRRMVSRQQSGVWEMFDVEMLAGKTMGIIGYGEIGRATAERARALGMRVVALRRRAGGDPCLVTKAELLAQSDYIVIATPITPETRGLIGEPELRAMKTNAVVVNVGRGPVVVESALIRALAEGWIRGAALDVYDTEPLPPEHPFWKMDNVLLSPHCADHTETWLEDAMEIFVDNFRRFLAGEELRNLVDKSGGY